MAVTKIYVNKNKTKIRWKVVVYIPTNKFDEQGNRIMKHQYVGCYETEREGKQAERKYLNNFENNTLELNKNATCKDVILFFIEYGEKEANYAEGTIANYKCIHEKYLNLFDDVPISRITPELIRHWRRELVIKKTSPYRINDCIKLLKASFNHAIKEREINTNPFKELKNEKLPIVLRKRFSISELRELFQSCREHLPEFFCVFFIACLSGMREGEYSALKVEDIDFNNALIYIQKQYTRGKLKNRTKTLESTRIVHPSLKTLEVIKWHMKTFNIQTGFLFLDSNGNKPINAKWVSRHFKKLLLVNDFPENFCRVHDLRGQYVDIQHAVGTPTEQIAREVGHSRTSTTSEIYTQILKEVPKEMNNRMDALLFNISS